ncbi:MAG: hypothetical protein EA349_15015 [Halomonadaceae bacterium]|nr:MAG: hypothetical protein EA349_15015 [Halomonadaceae bacterium]
MTLVNSLAALACVLLLMVLIACLAKGKITPWSKDPVIFRDNPFLFSAFMIMLCFAIALVTAGAWRI